jgi:hypothetical protein
MTPIKHSSVSEVPTTQYTEKQTPSPEINPNDTSKLIQNNLKK